jgi:D-serine deaminase-like pyridoxal phosphate-dependent protein
MSAEHGQLRVGPDAAPVAIGDRLEVVPGYADLTVFLHDRFYGFRSGRLAEILPIAGSDASQ